MRKFGLIGYPLGHSFSKKYFGNKFLNEGISDASYNLYPLTSLSELPALLSDVKDICGLNVTIPYKTDVIKYLTDIDKEAEKVGAVNVIKITGSPDGLRLKGFNSDIYGIEISIRELTEGIISDAIVLGTGGSSRAVCHVLDKLAINYITVSRNPGKGSLTYNDLTGQMIKDSRLIINTTPCGMYPDINCAPSIYYSSIDESHFLFDLVYNPEITLFLENGMKRGAKVLNGLRMLGLQAEKSWEIWNNPEI